MIAGLIVIGIEALHTIGAHGFLGDMMFVAAGSSFAVFGMMLRLWRVSPMPAVALTSIVSLVGLPLIFFSYENFLAAGLWENLLQAVVQGLFAGAGAVFLFTRAVFLLGASRAALFPALVPPFTLADRLCHARRSAERLAAHRACGRRLRLLADAEGVGLVVWRHARPCAGIPIRLARSMLNRDGRDKPGHDGINVHAALRLARNSPMRSSALRMFSVELA